MPTKKHKSLSDKGVTNCIWNSHQGLWLQRVDPFIYYPIVQERLCTYPRPSPQCHEDTPNRNHKESKDKPVDVIIMIIKCILESRSSIHHVSPSCVQHTLPKDLCMMQISKDLQRIHIYTIYYQNKIDTISTCLRKSVAIVTSNGHLPWACQCFHWCIEGIRCPLHLPTPLHTLLSIRAQHPAFKLAQINPCNWNQSMHNHALNISCSQILCVAISFSTPQSQERSKTTCIF